MSKEPNFFQRAFNAVIEGRMREAQRHVARLDISRVFDGKVNRR